MKVRWGLRSLLAFVLGAGLSLNAFAWGGDAHRLIAELAERRLSPVVKAEVDRLLSQEAGASMASVSTWADEVRRPGSALMHYVNLPADDCRYERQRDCAGGRCVVEAIAKQVAVLKSTSSDAERLTALKFIIHLVGDIHQPLHAGLKDDKGGNLFQVRAFGRGSNLHAVWDRELIRQRAGGLPQLLKDAAATGAMTASGTPALDPGRWASESCLVSRGAGFYPEGRLVGAGYQQRWDGVLVERLSTAASRLADTLNAALPPP